ncbi:hypothetical protein NDU88_008443 [Pleurodeles waltl]|uniref:Uncharacterized protein n=1 Tax=Pleurodeles waltl TaxID=8319 RepID=A0AAV7QNK5_PLEWA|nr:hypothetical protein NDU88_008443 [Pleurodeles waltl]
MPSCLARQGGGRKSGVTQEARHFRMLTLHPRRGIEVPQQLGPRPFHGLGVSAGRGYHWRNHPVAAWTLECAAVLGASVAPNSLSLGHPCHPVQPLLWAHLSPLSSLPVVLPFFQRPCRLGPGERFFNFLIQDSFLVLVTALVHGFVEKLGKQEESIRFKEFGAFGAVRTGGAYQRGSVAFPTCCPLWLKSTVTFIHNVDDAASFELVDLPVSQEVEIRLWFTVLHGRQL